MRNRLLALVVIFIVLGAGLFSFLEATSKRNLTITIPEGLQGYSVGIYRAGKGAQAAAPESFIDTKNLIKEITATTTISLKQGSYVVANKKNNDYEQQAETVTLDKKPAEITMKATYSNNKLADLLTANRSAVQQAVTTAIPLAKNYKFGAEKLFQNGDWYGATLIPNLSIEQERVTYVDKYHVIAHKESGTWKVLTPVPSLILSQVAYPDIPFDVLSETNKL